MLLIYNGLMNTLTKEEIDSMAPKIISMISQTLMNHNGYPFDVTCKRMATGLFSDMSTSMDLLIANHLDSTIPMLKFILKSEELPYDVKTNAVLAIGELCLMSEEKFLPYFDDTLEVLV